MWLVLFLMELQQVVYHHQKLGADRYQDNSMKLRNVHYWRLGYLDFNVENADRHRGWPQAVLKRLWHYKMDRPL